MKAYEHFNDREWDGEPMEPVEVKSEKPHGKQKSSKSDGAAAEPTDQPKKIKIKLADGKERQIQSMMATTFWDPSGKPISANQFVEKLFGELPRFFRNEDELRKLWSRPDTRKSLPQGLAGKGYAREQLSEISRMINAENCDLFDVLAYIAFACAPMTRSDRVTAHKGIIFAHYDEKLQAFLDFVLGQYIRQGVGELDQEKFCDLLTLKYHTIDDAEKQLGEVPTIREPFVGFQRFLYIGRNSKSDLPNPPQWYSGLRKDPEGPRAIGVTLFMALYEKCHPAQIP